LSNKVSLSHTRALDGVRGLAILLVIFAHFQYLEVGWVGVQLFFVLSGFLITSILVADSGLPLRLYLKRFYWRRTLRIFPLYFGYLGIIAVLFFTIGIPESFGRQFPSLLTYTSNFQTPGHAAESMGLAHLWSLAVEEQFYLLWPLIIFFVPAHRRFAVFCGIIVASPVFRTLSWQYLTQHFPPAAAFGETVYKLTPSQFDAFAAGAIAAITSRTRSVNRAHWLFYLSAGVTLAAGVTIIWVSKHHFTIDTSLGYPLHMFAHGEYIWGYTLLNFTAAALILSCLGNNWISRLFEARWMVYLGKISYGIYVYHMIIQFGFWKVAPNDPRSIAGLFTFAMYLVVLIMVSHLSFQFFERRFTALKDSRYTVRELRQRAVAAACAGPV
jgi:peptidoglycan/LPS O-acetylase OafA/YrhL